MITGEEWIDYNRFLQFGDEGWCLVEGPCLEHLNLCNPLGRYLIQTCYAEKGYLIQVTWERVWWIDDWDTRRIAWRLASKELPAQKEMI